MNNYPKVSREDGSKYTFLKKCKFDICFEHVYNFGFNTEKIAEAFYCGTIPIYFGSESIFDIFNKNSIIYIRDENDFKSAID